VIALLVNPNDPRAEGLARDLQEAARTKGVQLPILQAAAEGEIDASFASFTDLHADALLVSADPLFNNRREQIVALASRDAIPAIYPWRELAAAGGLISASAPSRAWGQRVFDGRCRTIAPVPSPSAACSSRVYF
jgi:putative ABC transport system substrate-binding protein